MKVQEAYKLLELPDTATPEQVKKQYRKLAGQFHPDTNKDPGAEAKMKQINEAFQVANTGKSTDPQSQSPYHNQGGRNPFGGMGGINLSDLFGGMGGQQKSYDTSPIDAHIEISFKDSILGVDKEIKYIRQTKCNSCNGAGEYSIHNGCTDCGGKGTKTVQRGNMIFQQACAKCQGKTSKQDCQPCQSQGTVEAQSSVKVKVPGGVINDNILRLGGMGHYAGNFGPVEQYGDVHLYIKVKPEPGLSLEDQDVICSLDLSLKEALQGCAKSVNTINGVQVIEVPKLSKHKEELVLPHLGVAKQGNQRVILNVQYPDDIESLLKHLNSRSN